MKTIVEIIYRKGQTSSLAKYTLIIDKISATIEFVAFNRPICKQMEGRQNYINMCKMKSS